MRRFLLIAILLCSWLPSWGQVKTAGLEMVEIPAGRFGGVSCKVEIAKTCPLDDPFTNVDESEDCTRHQAECDELDRSQKVTLTRSFFFSKTEVTQAQYYAVMGNNPSYYKTEELGYRSENNPVENISWLGAIEFVNALSKKEGLPLCYNPDGSLKVAGTIYDCKGYRLPTEAEWEYVARDQAAGQGTLKSATALDYYTGYNQTKPVTSGGANGYGVYGMLGNTWEHCHDWYDHYPVGTQSDPAGPNDGYYRVVRGGSWSFYAFLRVAAHRSKRSPSYASENIGIRVARTSSGGELSRLKNTIANRRRATADRRRTKERTVGLVKFDLIRNVFQEAGLPLFKIQQALNQRLPLVRKCYEQELVRTPQLKGKMTLLITIKKSGRVGMCEVSESIIDSKVLQRCIMRRLKFARLPAHSGEVIIELPIIFGGQK